jgi:hypothetical protein
LLGTLWDVCFFFEHTIGLLEDPKLRFHLFKVSL